MVVACHQRNEYEAIHADYKLVKIYPDVGGQPAPSGSMPGAGAPERHGDVRGVFGNPQVFQDTFLHLSSAFTQAIHAIEDESSSGIGFVGKALKAKLESMRDEIDGWRMGKGLPEVEKHGGELGKDVDLAKEDEGGLYRD
nr:hypothetical protein L203_01634 [Cryptococcus depauperatus CBS 7841]